MRKVNKNESILGMVAISNRHVHLTEEVYKKLFDEAISIKKPLNQIGQYAANQTVTIKTPNGEIERVRIVGPFRDYNQVEVSYGDAYRLGIKPPVRESGDLDESEAITIIGPKGEVHLDNVCIIAERHVHMNKHKAEELGLRHQDLVKLRVLNDKGGMMEAFVKVTDNGFFEIHIDRDDANAFMLNNGDMIEILK